MIKIPCPFCGLRNHEEFTPNGSALVRRPHFDDNSANITEKWIDFVYYRPNPRGAHLEYWQHSFGCRSWLIVERNTATHDIISVKMASPHGQMQVSRLHETEQKHGKNHE